MMMRLTARDVRAWRKDTGLSQAAFGRMLGVKGETVRAWERGDNKPKPWLCLARSGWYAQRSFAAQIAAMVPA